MTDLKAMPENMYLRWIKENKDILSINALEQYIGIPALSLHKYLKTDKFPSRHVPTLEIKMKLITNQDDGFWIQHVGELISERQRLKLAMRDMDLDTQQQVILNAKQEQILDTLLRLYVTAVSHYKGLDDFLRALIRPVAPSRFDEAWKYCHTASRKTYNDLLTDQE